MKKLILTEKPSVARDIARILGCNENKNGGIIGKDYIVTWALGHLVTLKLPEDINKDWQEWNLNNLPMIPKEFSTKVIPNVSKQFNCVKDFMNDSNISELIIATDAGREGELVARWIIEKVGFKKPMKRLWISSLTDAAIKNGFSHLVDYRVYDRLYEAAASRAKADWLVGLNISRALTCKYNASLSAGRVQTPTLSLIVEREKEINNFKAIPYYTISLKAYQKDFQLVKNNNVIKYFNKNEALSICEKIRNSKIYVKELVEKEKREVPSLLYDLTTLQEDANKLYSFSAKYTLDIVQRLYEEKKYLTYPRTDSKYLSKDMYQTIKERLLACSYHNFQKIVQQILEKPLTNSKRIFDNSKVTDHHAIIPTEIKPNIMNLSTDEERIYDLVVRRFLMVFMNDYEYLSTTLYVGNDDFLFKTSGKQTINQGFKVLLKNDDAINNKLDKDTYKIGNTVANFNVIINELKTTPLERFTEATLLDAMEHAGRFTTNTKEKQALENASGIGTPATRAEIIERIFDAGYVKLVGKTIYPTLKGMQLIELVPSSLKTVSLTANQEMSLEEISKGKKDSKTFIDEIILFTKDNVKMIKESQSRYQHDNMTNSKCPNCGKKLLDITNKFGKMLVCMDKNCGYKKNIYRNVNLRCPNCHKTMKQYGENDNSTLECSCGYKEKTKKFFEKIKDNNQGMSKKQLNKYIDNQNKEIPTNNPFADLFKN